jgi:Xaa-Pro aminopeptidase
MPLTREKLDQAQRLVREEGVAAWLVFVRETAATEDPSLPLLLDGGLTWVSALVVTPDRRVAVVGNYDAPAIEASGDWDAVVPYVAGIRDPLVGQLRELAPSGPIALNFSESDPMADGLTHGMWLALTALLEGTEFQGRLVSAEPVVSRLRGQKTPAELARIRAAVAAGDALFAEIARFARPGVSERAVYDHVHRLMSDRGLGFAWDAAGDPIVNSGPDSMIGHGRPSEHIRIAPGHVFHIDLGVTLAGYSSDVQRCWYVPQAGEREAPADVARALGAVNAAIGAGAAALRPGALGHEVDACARQTVVEAGYPEYMHALGHQVGRRAHDGGAILGPQWERYGTTPSVPVREGEVYTLELGVLVEGRGYLGIEEMAVVTADGCRFLTERQTEMPLLA